MLKPKDYKAINDIQNQINALFEEQDRIVAPYLKWVKAGTNQEIEELIQELPSGMAKNELRTELIRRKA